MSESKRRRKAKKTAVKTTKLFGEHMGNHKQDVSLYLSRDFMIANRGADIESTSYFESEIGAAGKMLLAWNAGAARLLIPHEHSHAYDELCTAKALMIHPFRHGGSVYFWLVFEDYSGHPYCLYISEAQLDRNIPITTNFDFKFILYSPSQKLLEVPGHFVPNMPGRFAQDILNAKIHIVMQHMA